MTQAALQKLFFSILPLINTFSESLVFRDTVTKQIRAAGFCEKEVLVLL